MTETVEACPNCNKAALENCNPNAKTGGESDRYEYRCGNCGVYTDDVVEREPNNNINRPGLPGKLSEY